MVPLAIAVVAIIASCSASVRRESDRSLPPPLPLPPSPPEYASLIREYHRENPRPIWAAGIQQDHFVAHSECLPIGNRGQEHVFRQAMVAKWMAVHQAIIGVCSANMKRTLNLPWDVSQSMKILMEWNWNTTQLYGEPCVDAGQLGIMVYARIPVAEARCYGEPL